MNTPRRHGPLGRGGRLLLRPAPRRTASTMPLRVRSLVGLIPLFAVEVLDDASSTGCRASEADAVVPREPAGPRAPHRLHRTRREPGGRRTAGCWPFPRASGSSACSRYMLDENEFLSPYGIRSLSADPPRPALRARTSRRASHRVDYEPGESTTGLFGGNSNWRGPVWFPVNYLLIEALERYHHFYGDTLKVECPDRLGPDARLCRRSPARSAPRLAGIFLPDAPGPRAPATATTRATPTIRTGRIWSSSTSTSTATPAAASAPATRPGWTALVVRCIEDLARARPARLGRRGQYPDRRAWSRAQ